MSSPGNACACACALLALGAGAMAAELPLGAARVTEVHGAAFRLLPGAAARLPLRPGDIVRPGQEVQTSPVAHTRLELTFPDGSLLRMMPAGAVRLPAAGRELAQRAGRVLYHGDVMIGGLPVLTPIAALFPVGTTYLVEVVEGGPVVVSVLEGAVRATRPQPQQTMVVAPGEVLIVDSQRPLGRPEAEYLPVVLSQEPLIIDFARPLSSLKRIQDLGDQQRRGVLAGRNDRLRRELSWQRPPLHVTLPEPFRPGPADSAPPSIQR